MTSKLPKINEVVEMGWVGSDIIAAVPVDYDLDLTDKMVEKLNTGGSLHEIKAEIDRAIEDRQSKLLFLKEAMYEQLDIAIRITIQERE
jgi:hypothetical protein